MKSTDRRRFLRRIAIGGSALVMLLPALLATAGTAQAAAGPNVVQARTASAVILPDAGATLVTVESVSLGKGSWTVTSNATAVNFGPGDYVRCQLDAYGSVLMDGGATTYLANRVGGVVDVGTWKSGVPFTVALRCDHDHVASYTSQFYFDPGVTLTAVRGGPIESPTIHTSATPTVVQSRTTSAFALVDTQWSPVTSVTLPPGTWAVSANASAVQFGSFDWAHCTVTVSSGATIVSSTPEVGVAPTDSTVSGVTVDATATMPAAGGTATLMCGSGFGNSAYLDPGATLTATLVPQVKSLVTHLIAPVDLPDAGASAADVVDQHMPAGSWRIATEVTGGLHASNNGYSPGSDFVRCGLWADGTRIDGGAAIISRGGYIEEIVHAGTFTATTSWTLRLSCAHDVAVPATYHWQIVDGMAQGIRKGPITTTP